ncbi:hypothetical protein CZ771_09430 [Actinomycetales bacterium JB111]|nr:hypothetical protein CZ771_09430 [Actinomycetales bacterium JB111]
MTWLEFALPTSVMFVLAVLPGAAMLYAVGLRLLLAVAIGPALTLAANAGFGIVYDLIGVPYTLTTVAVGMVIAIGVAAGLGHLLGTAHWVRGARRRPIVQPVALSGPLLLVLLGLLAVGTLVHCVSLAQGMTTPGQPVQTWDGVYHLGAIRTIQDTGNASVFGALGPMYDALASPYYPDVWHGMVAISPGFDLPSTAANASSFVMGPIWLLSGTALARIVWPHRPLAAVAAPLIGASLITTPGVLLGVVSLWPYAAGHICLPGLLGLTALAIRQLPDARRTAALVIPAAIGFLGAALAHGSAAFSILLLATPLVVGIYRACAHAWRNDNRRAVYLTIGTIVVLVALAATAMIALDALSMVLGFERGGQDSYWPVIGQLLIDNPMVYSYDYTQSFGQITVTALAVTGAVVAVRLRSGRWIVLGWILALVLTMLTAGPEDNPLRALAGFWYTQPSRVVVLVGIMAVPLASLGAATVARVVHGLWRTIRDQPAPDDADAALEHRPPRVLDTEVPHDTGRRDAPRAALAALLAVLAAIVVVTGGLRVGVKAEIITNTYVPGRIAWGTMLSEEEIDLVTRAGETLPDDAVVIGDPFAGAAYLYSLGGVDVLYRQLGQWDTPELQTLGTSFDEIYTNPEICEIVRELGVTHVITDTNPRGPYEDQEKYSYRTEGLAYVRPGEGFELVDRAGRTSIWRLTYCDQAGASGS